MGARILYEQMTPGVDPLGPDNMLGFVTGPFTGTPAICSGRFTVVGKSPLTGGWGDANCGGYWGPYLRFSGSTRSSSPESPAGRPPSSSTMARSRSTTPRTCGARIASRPSRR